MPKKRGGGTLPNNFGLKIGVEGEKGFKNSVREINRNVKELGSEMNLVTSQFDKQDKSNGGSDGMSTLNQTNF
jgi:hypothetical protein